MYWATGSPMPKNRPSTMASRSTACCMAWRTRMSSKGGLPVFMYIDMIDKLFDGAVSSPAAAACSACEGSR
jgi:hypothetical protein